VAECNQLTALPLKGLMDICGVMAGCWHSYRRIAAVLHGSGVTSFRPSRRGRTRDRELDTGEKRPPVWAGQLQTYVLMSCCQTSVVVLE